jgi:ComEC/Rec2-related protein
MRTRLLLLCLVWLLGLTAGVFRSFLLVWAALALVIFVCLLKRSSALFPMAAAGLVLFGLGVLWGGTSVAQADARAGCSDSLPVDGRIVARTKVTSTTATYQLQTVHCLLVMRTNALPLYTIGDAVRVQAKKIESIAELASDLPGYAQYLSDNHVQGVISYPTIQVRQKSRWWQGRGYELIRQKILTTFSEPETSFVLALLLGEQGETPSRVQYNFQATGLTHILSISGMNISLLTAVLLGCLLLLPLPGVLRTGSIIVILWAYISFIGWPISAVRAALFWTLTLLAVRLCRLVSLPTAFVLTAAAVLSYNPVWLRSISWQLSFGAVAGIGMALFLVRPYAVPAYNAWRIFLTVLAP